MSLSMRPAQHHVYAFRADGSVLAYRAGSTVREMDAGPYAETRIWELKRALPEFNTYMDLWGHSRTIRDGDAVAAWLRQLYDRLDAGEQPPRNDLLKAAFLTLTLGQARWLLRMRRHESIMYPVLSPQYRLLLPHLPLDIPRRSELLLHSCQPDVYIWLPPGWTGGTALVCFATQTNSLNAPRPLAHLILAQMGVALIYVGNRRTHDPALGLVGQGLEQSADQLLRWSRSLAIQRLVGLGTSLGGYLVMRYAPLLGLQRFINYSGAPAPDSAGSAMTPRLADALAALEPGQMKLVLSRSDPTDQSIHSSYQAAAYSGPIDWVDSPSHGSFTSSYLEGRWHEQMAWLLGGPVQSAAGVPAR